MSFSNLEWGLTDQQLAMLSVESMYILRIAAKKMDIAFKNHTFNSEFQAPSLGLSLCLKSVYFGHPCAITHIPRVGASWLGCMGNESMENMRKWSEVLFTYGKCKRPIVVANM